MPRCRKRSGAAGRGSAPGGPARRRDRHGAGPLVVEEIVAFARSRNATRVVVGKSRRSRWFELRHGSVVDELCVRDRGSPKVAPSAEPEPKAGPQDRLRDVPLTPGPYLEGISRRLSRRRPRDDRPADRAAQHLARLRAAGSARGSAARLVPSLWVSALSVTCFNFFFLPPLYQFTIADPANVMALFLFVVVAVMATPWRPAPARRPSRRDARRARRCVSTRSAAQDRGCRGAVRPAVDRRLAPRPSAQAEIVVLMPQRGELTTRAAFPPDGALSDADLAAARWSWECRPARGPRHRHAAGRALALPAHPHQPRGHRRDPACCRTRKVMN